MEGGVRDHPALDGKLTLEPHSPWDKGEAHPETAVESLVQWAKNVTQRGRY